MAVRVHIQQINIPTIILDDNAKNTSLEEYYIIEAINTLLPWLLHKEKQSNKKTTVIKNNGIVNMTARFFNIYDLNHHVNMQHKFLNVDMWIKPQISFNCYAKEGNKKESLLYKRRTCVFMCQMNPLFVALFQSFHLILIRLAPNIT